MVDGGFDPLHDGHVRYIAAAAELGAPVLCNVQSDAYVAGKHPVLLPQSQRIRVLDALRDVSYVHPSANTTAEVLDELAPRYYVKGTDWEGRLPELELQICDARGIEVVFVDTVTNSSSALLSDLAGRIATEPG